MAEQDEGKDKRSVHRSPAYPPYGLQEAIDKAKILWDKDGKHGTTREVALKHLGYTVKGDIAGMAARAISGLKKFGLTNESGERITLSHMALDIIVYPNTDERHIKALKEAALRPRIFNELYGKYIDGLPSDETLRAELIREREFNPRQVDGFLRDFRATLEYAGLTVGGGKPVEEEMPEQPRIDQPGQPINSRPAQLMSRLAVAYPIPLKNGEAMLSFSNLPVTEADIGKIRKWIDLFEDTLVADKPDTGGAS